ncbi:hypothetical protein [Streptomyces sp. NPDC054787]
MTNRDLASDLASSPAHAGVPTTPALTKARAPGGPCWYADDD